MEIRERRKWKEVVRTGKGGGRSEERRREGERKEGGR